MLHDMSGCRSVSTVSRAGSVEKPRVQHVKIENSRQLAEVFELGEKLGEGAFGCVLLATRKSDGQTFAVKKMAKLKDVKSTYGKSWENEIRVLRKFQHPHLVRLQSIFESPENIYLFMELCNAGNLEEELKRRGKFSENDAKSLLQQLGSALAFLHRCKIVHRDLKLQNCLLVWQQQNHLVLKLTDFGLSIELRGVDQALADNVGTPVFQAPEIVSGSSYSFKCDVWSFGILFYCLLHGCPPFSCRSESELVSQICEFQYANSCINCLVCRSVTAECREALRRLLLRSPIDRWSAAEFLQCQWITGSLGGDEAEDGGIMQLMRSMNKANAK